MEHTHAPFGFLTSLEEYANNSENSKSLLLSEIVYQSNLIEGIDSDYVRTCIVGREPEPDPYLMHHYQALDYVLKNYKDNVLTQDHIRNMHFILMKDLIDRPGLFKNVNVQVGRYGTPLPKEVPELMDYLDEKIKNFEYIDSEKMKQDVKIEDILKIHYTFENIHPFIDGNGRTGRLVLNWLSLKHLNSFYTVLASNKSDYFNAITTHLKLFKKEHSAVKFSKDISKNEWDEIIRKRQDALVLRILGDKKLNF